MGGGSEASGLGQKNQVDLQVSLTMGKDMAIVVDDSKAR